MSMRLCSIDGGGEGIDDVFGIRGCTTGDDVCLL
jgi:hypothetical protein